MPEEATTATNAAAAETSGVSTTTEAAATEATTEAADAGLGDAGKKALDAMKAERKAAREEAAAAKAERDALQARLDGKEAEHKAAQEKSATEAAALAKANDRILRSEVKAAAKGVLADPADAYKFLDLDSFEVSDDGDVDEAAIKAALEDLIKTKPYLAAQSGQRFQGGADGGTRNGGADKPSQLTAEDVTRLNKAGKYDEVVQAQKDGRLQNLMGGNK